MNGCTSMDVDPYYQVLEYLMIRWNSSFLYEAGAYLSFMYMLCYTYAQSPSKLKHSILLLMYKCRNGSYHKMNNNNSIPILYGRHIQMHLASKVMLFHNIIGKCHKKTEKLQKMFSKLIWTLFISVIIISLRGHIDRQKYSLKTRDEQATEWHKLS